MTLRWLNPSRRLPIAKSQSSIKWKCSRSDSYTVDAPEAGAESNITVPVESAGTHTFTVVPYLNGYAEQPPKSPRHGRAQTLPSRRQMWLSRPRGTERIITFSPVTEGANGSYIDTEAMRYLREPQRRNACRRPPRAYFSPTPTPTCLWQCTPTLSAHIAQVSKAIRHSPKPFSSAMPSLFPISPTSPMPLIRPVDFQQNRRRPQHMELQLRPTRP